ncbi:MAG: hypothetical protein WDN47_00390 [Candidatus Doudnabacteria bacterium]
MISKPSNKFFIALTFFLSGIFLILFVLNSQFTKYLSVKHINVTLTKDGFQPGKIEIKQGDTVTFVSDLDKPFWPASDLHPTHLLYPEFDPKQPIEPGKTWTFKFDKAGIWTYHNHLDPDILGTIIVHSAGNSKTAKIDPSSCDGLSDDVEKLKCWSTSLNNVLEYQGIEAAFGTLDSWLKSEPDFEPYCHTLVHEVGAKAYDLFSEHKSFGLTDQTSLCGYGFYHGFTETLAAEGGGIAQARQFCSFVYDELGSKLPGILDQCYHGFGHGSVDIHNEGIWGDEIAMIQPALKMCRAVATDSEKLFRCGTGMFDSISIGYFTHDYNLKMNSTDPFWLCRQQKEEEFKQSCYVSLDPALLLMENMDFSKASKFIENIKEDQHATLAMGSLALPVYWIKDRSGREAASKMDNFYQTQGVASCRTLQKRLIEPCIKSIAYALTMDESRTKQYQEGLKFCRRTDLTSAESGDCFNTVISTLSEIYPKDELGVICNQELKSEDKIYCQGKI